MRVEFHCQKLTTHWKMKSQKRVIHPAYIVNYPFNPKTNIILSRNTSIKKTKNGAFCVWEVLSFHLSICVSKFHL